MRRGRLLLFGVLLTSLPAFPQYFQQQLRYRIDVTLNDTDRTLDGFERIDYTNRSPDTLRFIWFHVWPNAYKNDRTRFSDQTLENDDTRFYFSNEADRGYLNRLDFKVDDRTAATEDHPEHADIIKLLLPDPLPPGVTVRITTPFHVKLPRNVSRGGFEGETFQATQWYPKPAVYDREGWHPMTYLDQGEFYAEFGDYDVRITLPSNYVVAATGRLQDESERSWLRSRSGYTWQPVKQRTKNAMGQFITRYQNYPASEKKTKTLQYVQENVHDFAWFADKRFITAMDTCTLPSGRTIDLISYFTPGREGTWSQSTTYMKKAIRFYSEAVGDYPYTIAQAVEGPAGGAGGMEYPTITLIGSVPDRRSLDLLLAHELGHNWFYGALASNERDHPWMDEGMNSFYEQRYAGSRYERSNFWSDRLLETIQAEHTDQPIATPSDELSTLNYSLIAYQKASVWMRELEKRLGRDSFRMAMQTYYKRWANRHPAPADFKATVEEVSGRRMDDLFDLLKRTGPLPIQHRAGTRVAFAVDVKKMRRIDERPVRNLLLFGPAAGGNSYDGVLAGLVLTNVQLPPTRFRFRIAPMYGTSSKKWGGSAFATLAFFPKGPFRKIEPAIQAAAFSMNEYRDASGQKTFLTLRKIVPGIKLILREKAPRSTQYRFLQFRSFFLREEGLRFYRDTVINGSDTSIFNRYRVNEQATTLHQLRLVIENNRALYPYRGEFKMESGRRFVRTSFTGQYFFNYPRGGGLNLRVFAGGFFYTNGRTRSRSYETDRYHLNLTGPNGYEDYTYSDYFIGRNRFDGFASQQIMVRDGAFKVRTDLLAARIGRSDAWLSALNLSTTIPDAVNPLTLLPVRIPLKLYLDIGTYSGAWESGADADRFLFNGGLQLSVAKETLNIYVPLVYSSVFGDYYKSVFLKNERFWKKISFSIDLAQFSLRKFNRSIPF